MSNIYNMNAPSHPFWDFVQEMNGRPLWGGSPRGGHRHPGQNDAQTSQGANEQNTNQQDNAEDPPEVDPATLRSDDEGHRRGRHGRCGRHERGEHGGRRGRGWGGRGGGQFGAFGPPFMFGAPFWGPGEHGPHPPPLGSFPFEGPHQHRPPPPPPPPASHPAPPAHPHGPSGLPPHPGHEDEHHRRGPSPPHHPFGRGRGGRHGPWGPGRHHHHHGPPSPPTHPFGPGNLQTFLSNLGERIGVDLTGAAQGLGLDQFMQSGTSENDFEPKTDIFDLPSNYTIHVSLPGAKKSDVGVDWDGENSALKIAGVVYRPEVDERILESLVVDGRRREVGVFEKIVRLGSKRQPANIDVGGINARMTDGVLIVKVPKVEEKKPVKRDVPIGSATPSPQRSDDRDLLFDAEDEGHEIEMRDADADRHVDEKTSSYGQSDKGETKDQYGHRQQDNRPQASSSSENAIDLTGDADVVVEPLPAYRADSVEIVDHDSTRMRNARSETLDVEEKGEGENKQQTTKPKQISSTHAHRYRHDNDKGRKDEGGEDDWENFDSSDDGEGEYVKIAVN